MRRIFEEKTKPLPISKEMVWKAYKHVRSNQGSAGIDKISIEQYEENLIDNLYKLWNRLASGSYFPKAVREKTIRKDNGKIRNLGIPTVSDRIAQQVIKDYLEPRLEKEFHESSYGYRPLKSAHQALTSVRENVRKYAWVIDLDITAFFDNVNHEKLMKALDRHVEERWVKMYIKRWLEAPIMTEAGIVIEKKGIGTPQGGVISPLLANLYLHYTFDKWMEHQFPENAFVRYADDIIIHCKTEEQSQLILERLTERLKQCNLSTHPDKTHIILCKDYRRKETGHKVSFDFLGFSFRPVGKPSKQGGMFLCYDCEISKKSYSKIVGEFRSSKFVRWANTWEDIANYFNPKIMGWIQYYHKLQPWTLLDVFYRFHIRLIKWVMKRFKRFRGKWKQAIKYCKYIYRHFRYLFYHWRLGYRLG